MKNYSKFLFLCLLFGSTPFMVIAQKGMRYPNFPESFENPPAIEPGYDKTVKELKTGKWYFFGARIDSTGNDRPTTGKFAARLVGNNPKSALVQMEFDLTEGSSKVTVSYSSYGAKADGSSKFILEYSTDGGKNWVKAGNEILAQSKSKQDATFELDLKGKVRFRINKLGLGKATEHLENGRLSIDDLAIYKN